MKEYNTPLVSVLITVYNDEKHIGTAVESILNQSFQDFEIVVVDDGSTDNTPMVLQKYSEADNRIKIFSQANSGTTKAANNGLSKSVGKYIARLDSGDYSYSHRLKYEVDFLEKNPNIALIGGGVHIIDVEGRIIGSRNINIKHPKNVLAHRCIFQQSDVMFRKEAIMKLGGYREKFKNAQDYDLWLRISEKYEIVKVNEIFGVWRLNAGGYTLSRTFEQKAEIEIIKKMAQKRLRGIDDGYSNYNGLQKVFVHRKKISNEQYLKIKIGFLLKDLRKKEAREMIAKEIKEMKWYKKMLLLSITYSPDFLLKIPIRLREYRLNNF